MQLSLSLLALPLLSALTVARALPVEREAQKDERVTRCIIEALSNALAKENVPPVTSECREILKGGKHEIAGKKNEGENQHYEEDRHLEESEKHHFGEKGSQEALERHEEKYYEGDEQNKDENEEEQHYKRTHDEERSKENNSEEDNRSIEVKSNRHARGHRDHNSNKEYLNYEERRYAAERREGDEEEQPRKWRHSEEDSGLADNSLQKSDNSENTSNGFHLKWPHRYDKTSEESSEEDKAIGLHGHPRERTHSEEMYSDREMDGSDGDLNNQGKVNGIYEHKKSNSEESEEEGSEEREKRLNGRIHYYKRNSHSHSEEDRRNTQQYKKNTGKSDESSEELEHMNNIRSYHKRNNVQEAYEKGKHYYEDEVNGYLGSDSEESEEDKQHHDKRTLSEEKSYYGEEKKWHNIEEEKRHHNRNTRHHSEEEEAEEENKYHSEEKRHFNEEDKRHNHNEKWHQTKEDAEEKSVSNEEGDEEERNTKHFPKMQRVWWHRMEDRSPGSEEETRHSKENHIYPEYEENNDKWEKRHYEKQHEEEDGEQEEEVNEGHALRQSFDDDFPEKRMYDRMEKLAHYLKSKKKSLEIPELYDFEEEDEKPHHEDEKRNMSHRTLTEEEEKELENLAAMDLELEKMAEKLHGNQRV
ncbi:secretogranin-1 [Scyliorhinus canicula]|uniref:secretogranin-1 n=1 Tax=Scyliorhinus canicula TaxID=7830 RepID=UPI0018F47ECA|nr:secretogranin-1 [Scyliorhinus canicula]